jgi:RNA polymerase sigma factor (sigma-70 family)
MGKNRYIWLDGVEVPVTEEVYRAYYRPLWREAKRKEVRGGMECSLDALKDSGFEAASDEKLIDELVADKLLLDELYAVLNELPDDERNLIDALFFEEKSERGVAASTGRSKTGIHKQKERILKKLRNLLKK